MAHESRQEPNIDLLAISALDRDTELSYVRRERDWLARAQAEGRAIPAGRMLPMLPPGTGNGSGNGGAPVAGGGHSGHLHAR